MDQVYQDFGVNTFDTASFDDGSSLLETDDVDASTLDSDYSDDISETRENDTDSLPADMLSHRRFISSLLYNNVSGGNKEQLFIAADEDEDNGDEMHLDHTQRMANDNSLATPDAVSNQG